MIRAKIEAIKGEGEAKGKRCKKIKKKKEGERGTFRRKMSQRERVRGTLRERESCLL